MTIATAQANPLLPPEYVDWQNSVELTARLVLVADMSFGNMLFHRRQKGVVVFQKKTGFI
jgi:hypothetical protein